MAKISLGVLIGNGSRLPALYEYAKASKGQLALSVVVSFKEKSEGLEWIKTKQIPTYFHRWSTYKTEGKSREEFNCDLAKLLQSHGVTWVFGVGWDIIWTPHFLDSFRDRVLNAHPFPLPDEPTETILYEDKIIPVLRGMNTLRRAWEMGLPLTGACVHFARPTVDVGPVIARETLPILPNESFSALEERHKELESRVLKQALDLVVQNRIKIEKEKVTILPSVSQPKEKRTKRKVLLIGGGGREHVLAWKLALSPLVDKIYCAPGNAGIASVAELVDIQPTDIDKLLVFAKEKEIDLTVVGPEGPLAAGIVDQFESQGLPIFGPTGAASRLEASKSWAVHFMERHGIAHPQTNVFYSLAKATTYAASLGGDCVIKADGLAMGKGVFVCNNMAQVDEALHTLLVKKTFGEAGETVLVQEKLIGEEVSVMAFCDGKIALPIIPAQDHKRVFDSDQGPNTGGMGSFAPSPLVTPTLMKKMHRILTLTIEGMREENMPYKGVLYAGFMIVDGEPYILEYNCRFGDPETQVQLPLLESDLLPILEACVEGVLTKELVRFKEAHCVCIVLTSGGYPGPYATGKRIQGLEKIPTGNGLFFFHAGTKQKNGTVYTDGGRVLSVSALGDSLSHAISKAYETIEHAVSFEGMHYRKDIGKKGTMHS